MAVISDKAKMAAFSEKEFDPKDTTMDNFAETFVDNILLRSNHNYGFRENEPIVTCNENYCFLECIEIAIHFLDRTLQSEYGNLYFEMKKGDFLNSESYERFAGILTEKYFPEGFDPNYFLIFCVTLSMVASFIYKLDPDTFDARGLAKKCIRHFAQRCKVPDDAWAGTRSSAKDIVKMLQDSVNELTPPNSSLVSDEIEHQVRFRGDIRDAPGNAENNLEQQKAYACSKIGKYLQEYIYSKSKSQTGLRLLKEPESLSAGNTSTSVLKGNKKSNCSESIDKLGSGTSNGVQKLILIISDIKMKIDLLQNEIRSWCK